MLVTVFRISYEFRSFIYTENGDVTERKREKKNHFLIPFVTASLIEFLVPCVAHRIRKNLQLIKLIADDYLDSF